MTRTALVTAAALAVSASLSAQTLKFEDVVRNLHNEDPKARIAAVRLLRDAKYPQAIGPVASLVTDPVDEVQIEAIAAELSFFLGQDLRSKHRVGLIIGSREPDAAEAAFDLGPSAVWPRTAPRALISALLAAVNDQNEVVRRQALYTLGVAGPTSLAPEDLQQLVKALDHPDPEVRAAAARVAGRLHVSAASDALLRAVNDSSAEVRYAAMRALGEIKDVDAVSALTDQFGYDEHGEGAAAALDALARIGSPESVALFKQHVADKDPALRRAAVEGLGRAGDASVIEDFERTATMDDHASVRLATAFALQMLGERHYAPRIIDALARDETAAQAKALLIELGPSIVPDVYPRLQESDPSVRIAVADVLGMIGSADVVPQLEAAAADKNPDVAAAAKRAIARIKAKAAQ